LLRRFPKPAATLSFLNTNKFFSSFFSKACILPTTWQMQSHTHTRNVLNSSVCFHFMQKNLNKNTYLITPWSKIFLEKLADFQLVKKFPVFYGTRRFITEFTSAGHLFLSSASSIQSIHPHTTSCRSILIVSSHLAWVSQVDSFPQVSNISSDIR